jgi:hypothetical protein
LLKAALVEGLAYGTGATTVALEGYQAGATLLSQMSVGDCRRRDPGMAYEEGGSSDSETEGESSSHCRMCVCIMCFESRTQGDGVEKFGGSSSEAPSPGRACLFAATSWRSPQNNPSQRSFALRKKKEFEVVASCYLDI